MKKYAVSLALATGVGKAAQAQKPGSTPEDASAPIPYANVQVIGPMPTKQCRSRMNRLFGVPA